MEKAFSRDVFDSSPYKNDLTDQWRGSGSQIHNQMSRAGSLWTRSRRSRQRERLRLNLRDRRCLQELQDRGPAQVELQGLWNQDNLEPPEQLRWRRSRKVQRQCLLKLKVKETKKHRDDRGESCEKRVNMRCGQQGGTKETQIDHLEQQEDGEKEARRPAREEPCRLHQDLDLHQ